MSAEKVKTFDHFLMNEFLSLEKENHNRDGFYFKAQVAFDKWQSQPTENKRYEKCFCKLASEIPKDADTVITNLKVGYVYFIELPPSQPKQGMEINWVKEIEDAANEYLKTHCDLSNTKEAVYAKGAFIDSANWFKSRLSDSTGWIKVDKDNVPERKIVLIAIKHLECTDLDVEVGYYSNGNWYFEDGDIIESIITIMYYKPFPNPPKI